MRAKTRPILFCTAQTARRRVDAHPLAGDAIVSVVLEAWELLMGVEIAAGVSLMGVDGIGPRTIAGCLENLIVRKLSTAAPQSWRGELSSVDKDAVCITNDRHSFEIKTSSSKYEFSGNKSFAATGATKRKNKDGYYLVVNYDDPRKTPEPKVRRVRFGWLDQEDWRPQASGTGQKAGIHSRDAERQLVTLYEAAVR
jgi:hypothetical protein